MFLLAILSALTGLSSRAQLVVNGTFTPQELVDSILLGPRVRAFNVQYTDMRMPLDFSMERISTSRFLSPEN